MTTGNVYFDYFIYGWMILAVIVFVSLQWKTAPYGRHTSSSWGPMISNRLGWILMEVPSLAIFAFFFLTGSSEKTVALWAAFAAYTFHYINRSFIFPLRIKTAGKKMPFAIVAMAVLFNMVNGFTNGYFLGNYASFMDSSWLTDPRFIIGVLLFIGGMVINWRSDNRLINLRKPGETGYKIPRGGLFKWVSCPNLLGEVIEWLGFFLMTWNIASLAFWIWTLANLLPRAVSHHKWYKEKFPDYPKERKAVIPFLW